jgi:hypothetical protein
MHPATAAPATASATDDIRCPVNLTIYKSHDRASYRPVPEKRASGVNNLLAQKFIGFMG